MHPIEDDRIPSNTIHTQLVRSITNAIEMVLRDRQDVLMLNDVLVDWGVAGNELVSPDVSVFFGITKPRGPIRIYRVPAEGVTTEVVIEVTSPSTRKPCVRSAARLELPRRLILERRRRDTMHESASSTLTTAYSAESHPHPRATTRNSSAAPRIPRATATIRRRASSMSSLVV